jgi:hypothetical protein
VERSAVEDLWRITLSQIPSELGKLAYLASLRHPNTGVYRHAGLAMRSGSVLADEALRISHERIFRAWLTLSLTDQKEDCELYWSGLLENKNVVLAAWISGQPFANWSPSCASQAERMNFTMHMQIVLDWFTSLSDDA